MTILSKHSSTVIHYTFLGINIFWIPFMDILSNSVLMMVMENSTIYQSKISHMVFY